jgi:hypothetical protein
MKENETRTWDVAGYAVKIDYRRRVLDISPDAGWKVLYEKGMIRKKQKPDGIYYVLQPTN